MSTIERKPILHGRDHLCGGADEIPGICDLMGLATGSYEEQVLAEPSLIGYWPLDDTGPVATDHSTHDNDLTEEGGISPSWGEAGPFEDIPASTAVFFDTDSGIVEDTDELTDDAADDTDLTQIGTATEPFTFEILAYPTGVEASNEGGIMGLYGYPSGDTGGIYLLLEEGADAGKVTVFRAGEQNMSPVALSLDEWVHLAATYDGATLRLYFDGEEQFAEATVTDHSPSGRLRVGSYHSPDVGGTLTQNFHGRLAQAAIYNEALSASTIASHANTRITGGGSGGGAIGGSGLIEVEY